MLVFVIALLLFGCSEGPRAESRQSREARSQNTTLDEALTIRILVLGDSLTAGYGLDDLSLAFPARLEGELNASGMDVDVLDAGISGDTTAGGRSRLDWSLAENPDAVIVGLGGNDGLRALDPDVTYDNLNAILARLQAEELPVLLAGMMAPPNLGRDYGKQFFGVYKRLANEYDVVFYPFLLEGVAGEVDLNQADRIHPNPDGVNVMVGKILPFAQKLVKRAQKARALDTAS